MKFVTAKMGQGYFVGVVDGTQSKILPLGKAIEARFGEHDFPTTMQEIIALGDPFIQVVHSLLEWAASDVVGEDLFIPLDAVTILAPIPRPNKNIFCVGKNYADHAIEMGSRDDIPEEMIVFTKTPTTVIGHQDIVLNHRELTMELDYEGELAVVIGKQGREISEEDALDYVFGYSIINDITARDIQTRHKQYFLGKSLDGTCPMGPWIVHASAIQNPNHLDIQTSVNGEIRQNSNTENFIFPIEKIISILSRGMTLEPGDIIATGTPAGVGKGYKPPRFLQPGDTVDITIENIGTLKNRIES